MPLLTITISSHFFAIKLPGIKKYFSIIHKILTFGVSNVSQYYDKIIC
jgi:hypothetical protein